MRRFRRFFIRLINVFAPRRGEDRLIAEIEEHIALQMQENVRAGMQPAEARRQAQLKFGTTEAIKEAYRDQCGLPAFETLLHDLRYGLRALRKSPVFAAVAIITLALGIAATTAVFSLFNAIILQPLRYGDAKQLVEVWQLWPGDAFRNPLPQTYLAWKTRATAFEHLAAVADTSFDLRGNPPIRIGAAEATPDFLPMLEVQPELGRVFTEEEARTNAHVLVLSHSLWQNQFASDPQILGKTLVLSGAPWTVIGVMPPSFSFLRNHDLWIPMFLDADHMQGHNSLLVVGRKGAGITLQAAEAQMRTLDANLRRDLPDLDGCPKCSVLLMPLKKFFGPRSNMVEICMGAVGFVLLIACANLAGLLLARGTARQKEIAMRMSLGASRWRIVRQLLLETALLAAFGSTVGLLLAFWTVRYLANMRMFQIPGGAPVAIDSAVLGFVVGLACLTALLSGLVPAWRAGKVQLVESLKAGSSGSGGSMGSAHQHRLRSALVIAEVALSVILLAGSGLLVRSLIAMLHVDPGFDPSDLLTMNVSLSRYKTAESQETFYERALERVRALPGVQSADLCTTLPFIGWNYGVAYRTENQPASALQRQFANLQVVSSGYFHTLRMRIVEGRPFSAEDTATSLPVVIINEHLARRLFNNTDPIGQRMVAAIRGRDQTPRQIVGVAADVKDESPAEPPSDDVYLPFTQSPVSWEYLVVRSGVIPATLTPEIRAVLAEIDRDQPIEDVATMRKRLDESVRGSSFMADSLTGFAVLALVLATVGIYGLIAYTTAQRTSEFGVRMALGAQRAHILKLVLHQGFRLTLTGVAIGVIAALMLTRFLSSMLYGVPPRDPVTFTAVSLILITVALLATYLPACRAAKIEPMLTLRSE